MFESYGNDDEKIFNGLLYAGIGERLAYILYKLVSLEKLI